MSDEKFDTEKFAGERGIPVGKSEGPVVNASKVRRIKMKTYNDIIRIYHPDGIVFVDLAYEQLTVYASFLGQTIICASKDRITVDDVSDENHIYVRYNGKFHK